MGTATGEAEARTRDPNDKGLFPRPLLFPRLNIDKRRFLRDLGSNHIHAVRGDLTRELAEFCAWLGIEHENFDAGQTTGGETG
jgi:L-fucose isomerase-like protein